MDAKTEKEFRRNDELFSLCGLNCSLCPMFISKQCTGCRAGSWCAKFCHIAPCSVKHGGIDYCFQCAEYPCKKYDGIDLRDSLMSHRNQKTDMAKAKRIGIEAYHDEQREKVRILHRFLDEYGDDDRDVFYCLAVNMLDIEDLNIAIKRTDAELESEDLQAKADCMERNLRLVAKEKNVPLKLRRWEGAW